MGLLAYSINRKAVARAVSKSIQTAPDGFAYLLRGLDHCGMRRWAEATPDIERAAQTSSLIPITRSAHLLQIAVQSQFYRVAGDAETKSKCKERMHTAADWLLSNASREHFPWHHIVLTSLQMDDPVFAHRLASERCREQPEQAFAWFQLAQAYRNMSASIPAFAAIAHAIKIRGAPHADLQWLDKEVREDLKRLDLNPDTAPLKDSWEQVNRQLGIRGN